MGKSTMIILLFWAMGSGRKNASPPVISSPPPIAKHQAENEQPPRPPEQKPGDARNASPLPNPS